jgi:hypothetical protein
VLVGAATVPVVETIAITAPQYLVNTTTGEIIYSESISGTNFLSVTRGADGTTAAQMESGQKLRPVYAANLYNQMVREIKAIAAEVDTKQDSFGYGSGLILSGTDALVDIDTGAGLTFSTADKLAVSLDTTKGLDFSSGKIGINADTDAGLKHSTGGKLQVSVTSGIGFSSGALRAISSDIDDDALTNFLSSEHVPVIDEDTMGSNSTGFVPTQQSVKAYIDTKVASYEPDVTWGDGLSNSSGTASVDADTTKGLDFSSGKLGVSIDTAQALDFSSGKLAVRAASSTGSGRVELATITETSSGTDATRAVTPDGLSGSIFGTKRIIIPVVSSTGALTTGDGKAYITLPAELNGMNLVDADACVYTASTNGTPTIQIHNLTDSHDLLTTRITIDATEKTSYTALTQPVIASSYDDVATADILRVDVDGKGSTATKGLEVHLAFRLP